MFVPNCPATLPPINGLVGTPIFPKSYVLAISTQDAVGVTLSACLVTVFRTIDNGVAAQGVSDVNGNFSVGASPALQHFVVIYKVQGAGLPDIFGTSVNTLVPV